MDARAGTRRETARYIQLADTFRRLIAEGKWAIGQRLPTIAELASDFKVAKVTVRQAMDILARDALIDSSPRRGIHVAGTPPVVRWHNLSAEWESFMQGIGTTEVLEQKLNVQLPKGAADPFTTAGRFHYAKVVGHRPPGIAIAVRDLFISHVIYKAVLARFPQEPAIEVLADFADEVRIFNEILPATREVADQLNIHPGMPVLRGRHIGMLKKRVLFLDFPVLRGDYIKLELLVERRRSPERAGNPGNSKPPRDVERRRLSAPTGSRRR